MRKIGLLILVAVIICFVNMGCLKHVDATASCTGTSVSADDASILAYLNTNNITGYVKDTTGVYYKIEDPGSGTTPTAYSKVFVTYSGTLTDHTVFDSLADASKSGWVLGSLIPGWQIGLPKIQKGGRIMLFIPSVYGYGCQQTAVPINSILIFEIQLVDVL